MITKYKYGLIGIILILVFCGIAQAQTQTGYRIPSRLDIGGGRMTGDMWCQYGTNGVRFIFGTQTVTQVGTSGVMTGTIASGSPSLDISYGGGSTSANFEGFNAVYVAGSQVGTSGALSDKLNAVDGIGTNNTFNNPTLAGQGTITASFGTNGLIISPAEFSSVNNATGELQAQITGKQDSIGQTPLGSSVGSVTAAMGSQSINAFNDCNIIFNENDFVKIVGGQLVAGSSSATVAFSAVTGSATASQLPLISGLLGSATASQLPPTTLRNVSSVTKTDAEQISGTGSWVGITGLSTTIVTATSTPKVLILANISISQVGPPGGIRITRNGTAVGIGNAAGSRNRCNSIIPADGDGAHNFGSICITYLDNPGTTTSTYSIEQYVYSSGVININRANSDSDTASYMRSSSTLTVMEVTQ